MDAGVRRKTLPDRLTDSAPVGYTKAMLKSNEPWSKLFGILMILVRMVQAWLIYLGNF